MNLRSTFVLILAALLTFTSCDNGSETKNVVETEAIPESFSLEFDRLDTALFNNSNSLERLVAWNQKKLASNDPFYPTYLMDILRVPADSGATLSLYRFSGQPHWKELQDEISKTWPNTKLADEQLNRAFGRFKTLLPLKPTPGIHYYNSGFNVGIWPDTNMIGIGMEWYLGKSNRLVKQLPSEFPQYQRDNMEPQFLATDAVKGWLLFNYYKPQYAKNLLEYISFYGKVFYAAQAALAPIQDTVLFSYTKKQMEWCFDQERRVWKEMVDNDLLYSADQNVMARMTSDGPFTPGFPQDGAPMAGCYIGYRMVADYMKKNPDTKLEDLFTKVTGDEILKAYKPKR